MAKEKKRSSKNLKINTRIVISSILTIVIPIVLISVFLPVIKEYVSEDIASFFEKRMGLVALAIIIVFVIGIIILSFITSRTIVHPIEKIAHGAEEIARGNLDYEIDYKSTNELGQTVDSFNDMRLRLKESIESHIESDRSRKELTAGLAHDLRTPLTTIKGYVEGLIDGIADTPEKQNRYLRAIYDASCQTEKMLDDLFLFSKLELGNVEIERTTVSVNAFISDAATAIKQILTERHFEFEVVSQFTENACLEIDTDGFQRVFTNIISNSIKYARSDVTGRVRLLVTEYENNIIMEFEDNGIGVEKENLAKIFDIMYRADPARSKVGEGSGLGLAVCKQIIEQNNGSIWARSHKRKGLSIFISLPKRMLSDEKNTNS